MPSSFELYQELTHLGNTVALSTGLDVHRVYTQLEEFKDSWHPYNARKGDFRRYGLSLTSLDGGLSGDPDLSSIRDHNTIHGTRHNEMSFRKLTPVYQACTEVQKIVEPFKESLGRSHFLKFNTGGFFPFHRDGPSMEVDRVFRIFVPLHLHSDRDFVFLLDDRRLHLEKGRAYFINTLLEHALFSFDNESLHLVMNVHVNESSVRAVHRLLFSY